MKRKLTLGFLSICLVTIGNANAQVSTLGNSGISTDYTGWDGNQTFPMDIRHNGQYPIDFYTDSTFRATIDSINGFLGLGLKNPMNLIHQHRVGNTDHYHQFTNGNTGATANDGFRIGINYDAVPDASIAELRQMENSHMTFFTNNQERARFDSLGNLLVNHINSNLAATVDINARGPFITSMGWNAAIKVRHQAAICFDNDDPNGTLGNRYYFTAGPSVNPVGDFWQALYPQPDNTQAPQYVYQLYGQGRANEPAQGVHRFRTTLIEDERIGVNTLFPSQRVEVVDGAATQLRLTNAFNAQPNLSVATDFETNALGDMIIRPHSGATARRLGINVATPITVFHVGGVHGISGAITSDFLNHAVAPTTPATTPWLVYSDANGTLRNLPTTGNANHVLHGDGSWSSGGNGNVNTGCGGTTINFIPKFSVTTTTICNSQIFDNGTNVGVGTPTPNSSHRLTVNGDVNLSASNHGFYLNGNRFLVSEGNGFNSNVYLGILSGPPGSNTNNGYANIMIGGNTGLSLNSDESGNIFIGGNAGNATSAGWPDGSNNVFVGSNCGTSNTEGKENVSVGVYSGSGAALGVETNNVFIGSYAASGESWGDHNVFVGHNTQFLDDREYNYSCAIGSDSRIQGNNSVALGENSYVQSDNCIVMGNPERTITLMGYTSDPSYGTFRLYVNPLSNNDAAYFEGDIFFNGAYNTSDISLKTDTHSIDPFIAKSILEQLVPKSFYYDTINNDFLSLPSGLQYGLIANEVELILPNLVKEVTSPPLLDTLGAVIRPEKTFKALNYVGLIPLLIKTSQDQQKQISDLSNRLNQLELMVDNCCKASDGTLKRRNSINIELKNESAIILNQNDPNPFAEETVITYVIPEFNKEAKIIIFDNKGHVLQTVIINEKGAGQLNVYAGDLTSGIYSYSLIVDGKIIDSKKMVCSK